jgi:hypothetical protein
MVLVRYHYSSNQDLANIQGVIDRYESGLLVTEFPADPLLPVDPFSVLGLDDILQKAEERVSQVPNLEEYLKNLSTPGK